MMAVSGITDRLGRIVGSGYVRAVATLSTGQFIAAAIPLVAAPILGRLYLPTDYGVLATYMAVGQVLAAVSTFQLQHGIIAEHSERRAEELVRVCRWSALAVAVLAALIGLAVYALMAGHAAYADGRGWVLLLPATTLGAGVTAAATALANRRRRYSDMARIQVVMVAVTVAASICLGLLGWGVHGLFASYFLGQAVVIASYALLEREMSTGAADGSGWRRLAAVARRHRRFAIFTLPSELISTVNLQMPVYALSAVGAAPLLGAFARARQLVSAPLTLLGSSIATVFRQRAAEQYRATGSCRPIYAKTFVTLAGIGILPTIMLMIFAPDFFEWFLGPNWREAGEIARILAPMLLLRLICSPLSSVFYITGAQKGEFTLSVAATMILSIATIGPVLYGAQLMAIVMGFATGYAVIYALYVSAGWLICKPQSP
jgi:O-antigen/teichoic acid export membrane protein